MTTLPTADAGLRSTLLSQRRGASAALLPLLFLLFVGSGCAALIYEVVWFQLLQFAVGSSAVSIAVLLGTFMGGMCVGSLAFSRFVSRQKHPLLIYALLELGIGLLGVGITAGMPAFDHLYAMLAHGAGAGVTLRAIIAALCLLPPTILMGATLPAISRWIENSPKGVSWLGFFYGGNTLGAVVGCLLAGFYLLRSFDMATASYVAAGINFAVAAIGICLSFATRYEAPTTEIKPSPVSPALRENLFGTTSIYIAIALSGMAALGGEVIWTRLLSLLLAGTTYTFSIILAVFLAGLGIGSSVGSMLTRSGVNVRNGLAWCQILCAAAIAWTSYAVTVGLPNWPVNPYYNTGMAAHFQLDLARCCWAILLPTLFWGASFPLALAAVVSASRSTDPAKAVGRVYAANTIGAIIGALFFGLIAIKTWGTQNSQHMLILLAGISAVITLLPALLTKLPEYASRSSMIGAAVCLIFAIASPVGMLAILNTPHPRPDDSTSTLDTVPWQLVAWGRRFRAWDYNNPNNEGYNDDSRKVFMREGMTSSVAVTRSGIDTLNFHVAGKIEASTLPQDMRLQLMLGHFPALFQGQPKKVLIVGCGAGVTAGSFILYPSVEKIVICEIEPLVPQVVATYFAAQNNDVVTRKENGQLVDPRVQIVYDDARHYVLTTDEKFDIITSDPIHPWVKGAASLYTQEYFDLVKKHLNPGGIVTQWVPLYESNTAVVKSEVATFFKAFPNGTIWRNDAAGSGYDVVLLGSDQPFTIDAAALDTRLSSSIIGGILSEVHLNTASDILKTYAGRASDLKAWTTDAQINSDRNLRLQYLAGEALNEDQANAIATEITSYRRYPDELIHAPDETRKLLENAWRLPKR